MRPYTRSLDPGDYEFLKDVDLLRMFAENMIAPHCLWHPHKLWENASILQQLNELRVPYKTPILDVGSGGMFFPVYLAAVAGYRNLALTDSLDARTDLAAMIDLQAKAYEIDLPFYVMRAEDMSALHSESYGVVMCISTIEHIAADQHDNALREMWRLTKPGGYIFITSDYFRSDGQGNIDQAQYNASPYRDGQATAYHKELVLNLPNIIDAQFVGDTDLDYRGDFVHNYSFCNICLKKAK